MSESKLIVEKKNNEAQILVKNDVKDIETRARESNQTNIEHEEDEASQIELLVEEHYYYEPVVEHRCTATSPLHHYHYSCGCFTNFDVIPTLDVPCVSFHELSLNNEFDESSLEHLDTNQAYIVDEPLDVTEKCDSCRSADQQCSGVTIEED
jgi:hypothetical protein